MTSRHFEFRSVIFDSDLGKTQHLLFFSDRLGSQGLVHAKSVLCSLTLSRTEPMSSSAGNWLK